MRRPFPSATKPADLSRERVYTTKHAVQTLIHDLEIETDKLKFLAVGTEPESFRLLIGSFHLDLLEPTQETDRPILHGYNSSANLALHATVSEESTGLRLSLFEMSTFKDVDPDIKSLTNTFNDYHAVSLYLKESLECLSEEHAVLDESRSEALHKLQKLDGSTGRPDQELFAFLLTGVPAAHVKEWLEDHLSDRLVKRWEKTCQTSLDNVRAIAFESCLPACDRLIIMAVKLREMSKNEVSKSKTEINSGHVEIVIKSVTLLIAQLHYLMRATIAETALFTNFCKWLSFAMARLSPDDEQPDAVMPVETSKIVEYLETQYPDGTVSHFFGEKKVDLAPFLELEKGLDTMDPFPNLDGPECPTLQQSKGYLDEAARQLFASPAQLLVKNWQLHSTRRLSSSHDVVFDSRFVQDEEQSSLYLSLSEYDETECCSHLFIVRVIEKELSRSEVCRVDFDVPGLSHHRIRDLKFIDDVELLILLQSTGSDKSSHILAIEYSELTFTPVDDLAEDICSTTQRAAKTMPSKHRILDAGMHPIALVVNGAKGRRTGLCLQADRQRYTIFDLDDEELDDESEASEVEGEDEMDAD